MREYMKFCKCGHGEPSHGRYPGAGCSYCECKWEPGQEREAACCELPQSHRHRAVASIASRRLGDLFNTERPIMIKGDFPKDAQVVGAFWHPLTDCIMVVLEHIDFPAQFEGCEPFHLGPLAIQEFDLEIDWDPLEQGL